MKKLVAFILAVALAMSLAACSTVVSAETAKEEEARFQRVKQCTVVGHEYTRIYIFVDTHTGVLYLGSLTSGYSFMTVLVNSDGTPMICEGYD